MERDRQRRSIGANHIRVGMMRRLLIALALALYPGLAAAQFATIGATPSATDSSDKLATTAWVQQFSSPSVFSVMDPAYGAKCDGTTDDTTAINSAFTAAKTLSQYPSGGSVTVIGPQGLNNKGCVVTSVNATGFSNYSSTNGAWLTVRDLQLICRGAGLTCFDATGNLGMTLANVSVLGDVTNVPSIGIQTARMQGQAACCINTFDKVRTGGYFQFASRYNMGGESINSLSSIFINNNSTNGTIYSLGSITAGSTYTNGTYTGVALTGGTGSGALATITVAGNAVTAVLVTYEGKGYVTSDVLSAAAASIGGTGSGFSIPVSAVAAFAVVEDGLNHWRCASAFQTCITAVDTAVSFTQVNYVEGSIRNFGTGPALWLSATTGHRFDRSYFASTGGPVCVELYDTGGGANNGLYFDAICENSASADFFIFAGIQTTPLLKGFHLKTLGTSQTNSLFTTTSRITSVRLYDFQLDVPFTTTAPLKVFDTPNLYTVSAANAYVDNAGNWNYPAAFAGCVTIQGSRNCTPAYVRPLDIYSTSVAAAYSCARQLISTYSGPLCNVIRASDSTTSDLYPDANGILDIVGFNAFCNGTTCKVARAYEQSASGAADAIQATAASQPTLTKQVAGMGNRACMTFGDAGAVALPVADSATIQNIWAAGGFAFMAVRQSGTPSAVNRFLFKGHWDFRYAGANNLPFFQQDAATTNGTWSATSGLTSVGHVISVLYDSSNVANTATITLDGTALTTTNVQPVGAITSDAASNLIIGNSLATAGTRGYTGDICEVALFKSQPSAAHLSAIRRNQGAFYGLTAVK